MYVKNVCLRMFVYVCVWKLITERRQKVGDLCFSYFSATPPNLAESVKKN